MNDEAEETAKEPAEREWWIEAKKWRHASEQARHGQVGATLDEYRAPGKLGTSTVRRWAACLSFAEQAIREHDWLTEEIASKIPLITMQTLKRVSRLDGFDLENALREAVAGRLRKSALLAMEREARASSRPRPREAGRSADAHEFRLLSGPFALSALRAFHALAEAEGGTFVQVKPPGPLAHLSMDGLFVDGADKWHAAKLMPATSRPADASRMADFLLLGLATARMLETFTLLIQREEDSDALAKAVAEFGNCGIAVTWVGGDGAPTIKAAATRRKTPDLGVRAAKTLQAYLKNLRPSQAKPSSSQEPSAARQRRSKRPTDGQDAS